MPSLMKDTQFLIEKMNLLYNHTKKIELLSRRLMVENKGEGSAKLNKIILNNVTLLNSMLQTGKMAIAQELARIKAEEPRNVGEINLLRTMNSDLNNLKTNINAFSNRIDQRMNIAGKKRDFESTFPKVPAHA